MGNYLLDKGAEIMSDWLSVCCSAPPHYMFEMSGDAYTGVTGLCSSCGDHTEFREYSEEDDE